MIRNSSIITLTMLLCGCHVLPWTTQRQSVVGPPLPMSVSCEELVTHLNDQSGNLRGWQSTSVKLTARLPGAPPMPAMKGNIACESPNRFHLTASNFAASADMGANSERCWFQATPGHHGVISWQHKDAHLLQDFPSQIPYIDPDWLMLVLGVKKLDPDDYVLEPGKDPRMKELWLTSRRSTPNSDVYRYVIKVSTKQRVVVEHAAYDRDHRLIVRARLSNHQRFDGHLIPTTVRIDLPANDAELKLTFSRIETNPTIDSAMWVVPSVPNGDNIDLGQLIRERRLVSNPAFTEPEPEPRAQGQLMGWERPGSELPADGARSAIVPPDWSSDGIPVEPEWSAMVESDSPFGHQDNQPRRRKRFLGLFPLW